jgi:hypothetical protein
MKLLSFEGCALAGYWSPIPAGEVEEKDQRPRHILLSSRYNKAFFCSNTYKLLSSYFVGSEPPPVGFSSGIWSGLSCQKIILVAPYSTINSTVGANAPRQDYIIYFL